ncbi:MaoC family dehydratase [Mycobacterium sp. SMC-8]|uniref:MaoC family dehydratase n=1 Tax=Mycobacterium sp. SMC-8 TaxID=2857060 RepID=UPI0021B1D7BB|nr:MaoC family dehydratase [Mycobacterium sp. SMC-8]UXA15542.1 MaoC family dehydratase [Mycobacterium sp. SMC-8]
MTVFADLTEFASAAGAELGPTEWLAIDQARVDQFAQATDDHQWIHVDTLRAAEGPFGGTIAHGLLTLSLLPRFMHDLYRVDKVSMAINYGFNKVRFITPVPAGSRLRAASKVTAVTEVSGGVQGTFSTTIEVEGSDKPAAVVESVIRYLA